MRRTLLLLPLLLLFPASPAHAFPDLQWARQYGQDGSFHEGIGVAVGAGGQVADTGSFQGTVDFGSGPLTSTNFTSIYLTLHAPAGALLWAQAFDGTGFDTGHAVAIDDAGNLYLGGQYSVGIDFGGGPLVGGGAFLAKFDAAGTHQWSQALGASDLRDLCLVPGGVVATGYFSGTTDLGGGPVTSAGGNDMFVARYDDTGAFVWAATGGGVGSELGLAVATDPAGNVAVSGESRDDADFGGGTLAKLGSKDAFLAIYNASGVHQWSQRFGAAGGQAVGQGVAFDGAGNVILATDVTGGIDFGGGALSDLGSWDLAVARFDPAGYHLWSARHGGASADQQADVVATSSHGVVLSGYFRATANFGGPSPITASGGQDLVLVSYSPDGAWQWTKTAGGNSGTHYTTPRKLAIAQGRAFLTGNFNGILDIGAGFLDARPSGGTDAFVVGWRVDTGDTPVGLAVPVTPTDPRTGSTPVDLQFDEITAAGGTALSVQPTGPPVPGSFTVGGSPLFYEISTTASFSGNIELCVHYSETSLPGPEADVELLHYDSTLDPPAWVPITTTRDPANDIVCGVTSSLSPFVLAAPADPTSAGSSRPRVLTLRPNIPNPFNPSTLIVFDLDRDARVQLEIRDSRGRQLRTLDAGRLRAGSGHSLRWDGRDGAGREVASGVYRYRVVAGDLDQAWGEMVLLR